MEVELAAQTVGRTATAERHKRRLVQLDSQREKLVQAYYASAISVDLLKREQERIDGEVEIIQQEIGVDTGKLEQARDLAEMAMTVLGSARETYVDASPNARQRLNKVIFNRVLIERGKVREYEYQEPFRVLVSWVSNVTHLTRPRVSELTRPRRSSGLLSPSSSSSSSPPCPRVS